ncbi:glycoside hydrolase family 92 protein [Rhizoctonia solani]|uniref:60S ribosomal protein L6 n=1 Tax=Rhizoctonia solani TaxID=456999 RepID=A0A8H8NNE1_9AGAM|nr:glycoside hydrolase family 92 protein [Rhizoctonia solani]QRW15832.1 glycoside hydrolase family 92 protein [Rhizoctonia solani]
MARTKDTRASLPTRRGLKGSKAATKEAGPEHKEVKVGGPKNGETRLVPTSKVSRFYPGEDVRTKRKSARVAAPTKLRDSITPGTVLILLAGRFRGKRVVFLKQLDSGLLLVTGPYKVNGVPLRRVNQAYVIATSTKIDLSSVSIDEKINDKYFSRPASTTSGDKESEFFSEGKPKPKEAYPEAKASDQKTIDQALLAEIKKTENLSKYLKASFGLSKGQMTFIPFWQNPTASRTTTATSNASEGGNGASPRSWDGRIVRIKSPPEWACIPGATIPHGMIKAGLDTDSPDRHAGYDRNISYNATGFSQLHDTGTGGVRPRPHLPPSTSLIYSNTIPLHRDILSNFKIWPFVSCKRFGECPTSIAGRKLKRQALKDGSLPDIAEPGYFATTLVSGVHVELTATRRAALHRYTFPKNSKQPRILVDITNDGQQSATNPFTVIDPSTGRTKGGASFAASFGAGRYNAYVCVDVKGDGFDTNVTEYGVWQGNSAVQHSVQLSQLYLGATNEAGSLVTYTSSTGTNTTLLVRVGVSFISAEKACASAEEEIPDFDFARIRSESRAKWNDLLGRIYRTAIVPANYTGDNPHWNSSSPYFDSYYCNWDSYRTLYPWYAMTDPRTFAQIVEAQIDIWRNEGKLSPFLDLTRSKSALRMATRVPGCNHADPILAEYYVKWGSHSSELGVSNDDLYSALVTNAEKQPDNWNLQGRQTEVWKKYGYVPADIWEPSGANTKQASRSVEVNYTYITQVRDISSNSTKYAFGDFCISQVAKGLNKTEDHEKYAKRASNFLNSWDDTVSIDGHTGFIQNRFQNGTFNFTDPRHCSIHDPLESTCYLNAINTDGFYESSPIVYSQYVPHDTAKLIELQGGKDKFVKRLDWIFEKGYFDVSNEPSQQMPFMYHYADQPHKSTKRSREVISKFYNLRIQAFQATMTLMMWYSGAMASYAAFYLIGLYPLPATRQILLSSPWFPSVNITNAFTNTTTTINAINFNGNGNSSGDRVYVRNVTVNGQIWKSRCWLDWDVFEKGGVVDLVLGEYEDGSEEEDGGMRRFACFVVDWRSGKLDPRNISQ